MEFLRRLYQPGPAMLSFNQDCVTMAMLGQLALSVVRESSEVLDTWGVLCQCPGLQPMLPVYKSLDKVWDELRYKEEDVMERLMSC